MMVLVTVESPRGRVTLAVPDDVPVEQLLPPLVEACRCEAAAVPWSLRPRGGAVLDAGRTLEESGLYQGAVLELQAEELTSRPGGQPHLASWAEVARYHSARALAAVSLSAKRCLAAAAPWRLARLVPAPRAIGAAGPVADADRAVSGAILERALLVAVVGAEPGAGATTVAALLATRLAALRHDMVAAVDTDSLSASLSVSLVPGRRVPVADLASVVSPHGTGALRQSLVAERHGLLVLPAASLAGGGTATLPDQAVYTALLAQLTRSAKLAVVDCGVADRPGGRAALESADVGVIVSRPEELGGRRLEQALRAARVSCRSLVVVVNRSRRPRSRHPGRGVRLAMADAPGADHTVRLSDEPAAAARLRAAAFSWETAPRSWLGELSGLAAALVVGRPPY